MDEYSSSGFCIRATRGGGGGTKCGRWNPTGEQVKVLTELFRSGLRTPSTDQIQKISSQLSVYGKIESKNVFYWFQNHKARERQKRRRVSMQLDHLQDTTTNNLSSTKYYCDEVINIDDHVLEPERVVMETLQLFPLNESAAINPDKLRRNGSTTFAYNFIGAREIDYQPALDLRLSFV